MAWPPEPNSLREAGLSSTFTLKLPTVRAATQLACVAAYPGEQQGHLPAPLGRRWDIRHTGAVCAVSAGCHVEEGAEPKGKAPDLLVERRSTLNYGHEHLVMTERKRFQIQLLK